MSGRRASGRGALTLITAAAVSYASNAAFGAAVAVGAIDSRRIRWVHHALYVATTSLTTAAIAASAIERRPADLALLPVFGPLIALPYASGHVRRHAARRVGGADVCHRPHSGLEETLMEFLDVVRRRRTTNGAFLPDPVSEEHRRLLMGVAGRAPSQLNSQPWRFVIVEERPTIEAIARISGESMAEAMSDGTFFERYQPYSRFSKEEMERRRDGMLFHRLPAPLRPSTSQVFTARGQKLMNAMRVPQS